MKLDIPLIRATVIAHAIRLGKTPAPGMVLDFAFQLSDINTDDLAAGNMDAAVPRTEKQRVQFAVTAEDLKAGKKLINDQKAQYREPKLTTVNLHDDLCGCVVCVGRGNDSNDD